MNVFPEIMRVLSPLWYASDEFSQARLGFPVFVQQVVVPMVVFLDKKGYIVNRTLTINSLGRMRTHEE